MDIFKPDQRLPVSATADGDTYVSAPVCSVNTTPTANPQSSLRYVLPQLEGISRFARGQGFDDCMSRILLFTKSDANQLAQYNTTVTQHIQEPLRVNHNMWASIRAIESRCLPLQAVFRSFDKTVQTLHKANNALRDCGTLLHLSWHKMDQLLDNYESHADAYLQAASFLQSWATTTAQLIADNLSFNNSYTAQQQSDYMLSLTSSTVDDSSTVRVITVVTLIYLPSTFMAVCFPLQICSCWEYSRITDIVS